MENEGIDNKGYYWELDDYIGWKFRGLHSSNSLKPVVRSSVRSSVRPSGKITFGPEGPLSPPQELERAPGRGAELLVKNNGIDISLEGRNECQWGWDGLKSEESEGIEVSEK